MAQSGLIVHCAQAVRMGYHSVYTVDGVYIIVVIMRTPVSFVKVCEAIKQHDLIFMPYYM